MEQKPKLLFLCHRLPFPPNRGDKIRSYHLLQLLAEKFDIYLGCCYEYAEELEHQQALKHLVQELKCVYTANTKFALVQDVLAALASNRSVSEQHFRNSELQQWVNCKFEQLDLSGVFVYCSAMTGYLPEDNHIDLTVVADLIDLDSLKWSDLANSNSGPKKWIYQREARCVEKLERTLIKRAQHAFFVSQLELDLSLSQLGEIAQKCTVIGNGVDLDYFSSLPVNVDFFQAEQQHLVYTGSMDAVHNAESVIWFLKHCWPTLQQRIPNLILHIVGRNPRPELHKYASERVCLVSNVADIRPYIVNADLIIAPMKYSRGVQNKILEAMACGKAVVMTPEGAEGIALPSEQNAYICHSANDFIDGVSGLLSDKIHKAQLGRRNQEWVKHRYSWQKQLEPLNNFFMDRHSDKT